MKNIRGIIVLLLICLCIICACTPETALDEPCDQVAVVIEDTGLVSAYYSDRSFVLINPVGNRTELNFKTTGFDRYYESGKCESYAEVLDMTFNSDNRYEMNVRILASVKRNGNFKQYIPTFEFNLYKDGQTVMTYNEADFLSDWRAINDSVARFHDDSGLVYLSRKKFILKRIN